MPKSRPDLANEINGEAHILSFILRIWKDESTPESQDASWRGHITPVPNGKRHYFTNISEIPDLIATHLKIDR